MSEPVTHEQKENCLCLQGNFDYHNFKRTHLGGDSYDGKVDLLTCKLCDRHWLHIFYEPKVHDDAAQWYAGLIALDDIPSISSGDVLKNALAYLEALDWYYTGGTYWSDIGLKVPFKGLGKITLRP